MSDLIVKLYDPSLTTALTNSPANLLADEGSPFADGVIIKRAHIIDKEAILSFIRQTFPNSLPWVNECEYSLFNQPTTCFIAVQHNQVVGFACYDATAKGFFGPMGVNPALRGLGVGRSLLFRCLTAMKEVGYAYAIIGWPATEAVDFYHRVAGAIPIPDSGPESSIYQLRLASPC